MNAVWNFIYKSCVIARQDIIKLRRDPTELITRAIQPTLWLLLFGQVFGRLRTMPTGDIPYLDFMTPGILAQSVLFISIFYGISVIWERDLGIIHKLLVSPIPRAALVTGKALSASLRGLTQTVIIYTLALLIGVRVDWNPLNLAGVLIAVLLGAACFCVLSLIIACIVKTRERFMGIGQLLTMPLFFASNAIYPVSLMPHWLQIVAHVNPLTYEVDALRALMLPMGVSAYGIGCDFLVLAGTGTVLILIAAKLYPNVVR